MMRLLILIIFFSIPSLLEAACVDAKAANLRTGPGTRYKVSWKVQRYMPFKILKKKKGWYRVSDVDGDPHWILAKLLTKKYMCAVIKAKVANMRTGPGAGYKLSSLYPKANQYDSFKYLKKKGSWVHIEDPDGDKYWVHRKLIWVQ